MDNEEENVPPIDDRDVVEEGKKEKEKITKEKSKSPFDKKVDSSKNWFTSITDILVILSGSLFQPINRAIRPVPSTFVPNLIAYDYTLFKYFYAIQKQKKVEVEFLGCTRHEYLLISTHIFIYCVFRLMIKANLIVGDSIKNYMTWFEKIHKRNCIMVSPIERKFFSSLSICYRHNRRNRVCPALPDQPGRPALPGHVAGQSHTFRSMSYYLMQLIPCPSILSIIINEQANTAPGAGATFPAPTSQSAAKDAQSGRNARNNIVGVRYPYQLSPPITNQIIGNMQDGVILPPVQILENAGANAWQNAADYPDDNWMSAMMVNTPSLEAMFVSYNSRVQSFKACEPGSTMNIMDFVDELLAAEKVDGAVIYEKHFDNVPHNATDSLAPYIQNVEDREQLTPSELIQASEAMININPMNDPLEQPNGNNVVVGTLNAIANPTIAQVSPAVGIRNGETRFGRYWREGFLASYGPVDFGAATEVYFDNYFKV